MHHARVDHVRVDPVRVDPVRVDHARVDPASMAHARVDHARRAGYLLVWLYVWGLIGLNLPSYAWLFQLLTPVNLVGSVGLLLYFHRDWNTPFRAFGVFSMLFGFGIEVVGVHTGLIFGQYRYETTLGPTLWGVPPLIGVNWLMLVYCVGSLLAPVKSPEEPSQRIRLSIRTALLGATILTLFDWVVEPVAVEQAMWTWYGQPPPLQNYLGWFGVSACLLFLFQLLPFEKQNPLAKWLAAANVLFFGGMRLL